MFGWQTVTTFQLILRHSLLDNISAYAQFVCAGAVQFVYEFLSLSTHKENRRYQEPTLNPSCEQSVKYDCAVSADMFAWSLSVWVTSILSWASVGSKIANMFIVIWGGLSINSIAVTVSYGEIGCKLFCFKVLWCQFYYFCKLNFKWYKICKLYL